MVVHPRLHNGDLRLLLLQLLHIRFRLRSQFRALPLADTVVHPGRLAQPCLSR